MRRGRIILSPTRAAALHGINNFKVLLAAIACRASRKGARTALLLFRRTSRSPPARRHYYDYDYSQMAIRVSISPAWFIARRVGHRLQVIKIGLKAIDAMPAISLQGEVLLIFTLTLRRHASAATVIII